MTLLLGALTLAVGVAAIMGAALVAQGARELHQWLPWLATRLIRRSVGALPAGDRERYEEEWLAEMAELPAQGFTSLVFSVRVALRAPRTGRALRNEVVPRGPIRLWEMAASSLGIVAFSPLLLACALLVRLSGPGPIFVRRVRQGRSGTRFHLLSFRTRPESDGASRTLPIAPTAAGRLLELSSLDALPRLYNVLRGDVGIIGPPALSPDVELPEDHPLRPYYEGGGRPGLVSWLTIATLQTNDPDTYFRAAERDARMLASLHIRERMRLLLAMVSVLARRDAPSLG